VASYETDEALVIRTRFEDQWVDSGGNARTVIDGPNEPFTPPTDGSAWVRFRIRNEEASLADVDPAAARHRFPGVVIVQVFTKALTGEKENNDLCQDVINIFNWWSSGEIRFRTAFKRSVDEDDGAWYQQNVLCPFSRDSLIALV
jgi:hypothetical protein